jgi:hypothetical protein
MLASRLSPIKLLHGSSVGGTHGDLSRIQVSAVWFELELWIMWNTMKAKRQHETQADRHAHFRPRVKPDVVKTPHVGTSQ